MLGAGGVQNLMHEGRSLHDHGRATYGVSNTTGAFDNLRGASPIRTLGECVSLELLAVSHQRLAPIIHATNVVQPSEIPLIDLHSTWILE